MKPKDEGPRNGGRLIYLRGKVVASKVNKTLRRTEAGGQWTRRDCVGWAFATEVLAQAQDCVMVEVRDRARKRTFVAPMAMLIEKGVRVDVPRFGAQVVLPLSRWTIIPDAGTPGQLTLDLVGGRS